MIRCYITDRRSLPPGVSILDVIAKTKPDWVQVRENDLPAGELFHLVRAVVATHAKVIVNTRMDVALAAGAAGLAGGTAASPAGGGGACEPSGFCSSAIDSVKEEDYFYHRG